MLEIEMQCHEKSFRLELKSLASWTLGPLTTRHECLGQRPYFSWASRRLGYTLAAEGL